ncbi:hypothetical protein VPH35_035098 [Triticum aestivum]
MNGRPAPFNLYRIDPAKLFYPAGGASATATSSEERPSDPTTMMKSRLPRPAISFDWPCEKNLAAAGQIDFMSIGRGGNAIVAVDNVGRTILYDAELHTIRTSLPMMSQPMRDPIAIAVGDDDLFVMASRPGPRPQMECFQALLRDSNSSSSFKKWRWIYLQPPPFTWRCEYDHHPICCCCRYHDSDGLLGTEFQDAFAICAHTMVGDSQIWISTPAAGTYTLDTESGAWSKAGDWALPFRGRAVYVPEDGLWFGFSPDYEQLCAFDLTAMSTATAPPVPLMAWDDLDWPESWVPTAGRIVPLGSGRFCVARFFYTWVNQLITFASGLTYDSHTTTNLAVLTGVEVERGGAHGLGRMVRHKSKRSRELQAGDAENAMHVGESMKLCPFAAFCAPSNDFNEEVV